MRVLVDTSPVNAFSKGAINLGLEIVARKMQEEGRLHRCHYLDVLDEREKRETTEFCFSVPYVLHALNIVPFLKRNGIEPLRRNRTGIIPNSQFRGVVVGGSAIHPLPALEEIVDEQFLGEYDGDTVGLDLKTARTKENRFSWRREIESEVYIKTEKYRGLLAPLNENVVIKEAVLELARGCPNSCQFCEYRWIVGGKYREKPFELLEKQLVSIHPEAFRKSSSKLVKRLTVRTSNLSACTYLPDLSTLCQKLNRKLLWAEVSPKDGMKLIDFIEPLGITRINFGIESFTESVRKSMCKWISDDELAILLRVLMQKLAFIKINLVYGLPGETDYSAWFDWLKRIAEIRRHISHKVRLDFAISNLELGGISDEYLQQAFADFGGSNYHSSIFNLQYSIFNSAPIASIATSIDFRYKEAVFLPKWIQTLRELNLSYRHADLFPLDTDASGNCRIHGRDFGRSGRTELNHLVIIALRNLPASVITDALCNSFPSGAHRYFSQHQAKSFLNKLKFN